MSTSANAVIARDDKPTLNQLLCISFTNDEDISQSFRVMDRLRPYWMSFAIALRFPHYTVRTLEKEKDPIFCLLGEWLRGANQEHDTTPLTWTTFVRALRDANLREEANILEKFILYQAMSTESLDADGPPDARPSSSAGRRRYFSDGSTPPHSRSTTPLGSRPGTPNSRPGSGRYRTPSTPPMSRLGTPDRPQSRSGSSKIHGNTTPQPETRTTRPKSHSVPEVVIHPLRTRRKSAASRYSKHHKDRSGARSAPLGDRLPSLPPSHPRPRSHYDDRRGSCAEIQVDAKVVEEVRDLQTSFTNMLTDIRKLGAKCDLEEVKFFLGDLLETEDFQQCKSFDDVLRTLHVKKHVSAFNVYYLEQLADRCNETNMKLSIKKFNKERKQFLDIKPVTEFHTTLTNLVQADQTLTDLTITIPRQLSNKRVIKGIEELAALVFIRPLNLSVVDGTNDFLTL